MKNFMNCNIDIRDINIACYVPPGAGVPIHRNRPFHGLVLQSSAASNIYEFIGGKTITIDRNEIIYLPKGSDYNAYAVIEEQSSCYAINFQIGNEESFKPFKLRPKNTSVFVEYFKRAEQAWKQKPYNFELKCKAELYNIIFSMQQEFRLGYAGREKQEIIRPAIEYIHSKYTTENISVEYLAELCGITAAYLRQLFKNAYGTSPIKYINNLKIERSKELMESGLYTISESAFLSGFSDISHFSREFKKAEKIPPSEYSKNL
ncbi:MAG: helix-turn-helix transcriptional regulator [Clostridia bacterium]|nr:helix-turn-helix transcriptional regulator [Clostridia bacterium]